ncbi:LOW QUALITY PROTEIN: (3R)-3-hydroxyacyl-CoA dehydrogenase [Grus americana]|uniref:LOW QUALITY PROTEIN: (3R)-3-hydroxyacyl-CoA dehydrogenase n=1 Tax=Grus americana TaxID=9117 RepID=UPI00240785CC|nr:LOW QUALITY PROTEIN: (3R)-3-hydroxyacyl-CoA dehydrogenase [Grus americana]
MGSAGRLGGALALVTGGASGIGRAVCARLAREGARLAVADRDEGGRGTRWGGSTRGGGPHAGGGPPHAAFEVDVASAPSVTRLLARVQEHFGVPPTICVGCAGVTRDEFLLRLGEGDFQEVLGVNLTGTFLVTQAVAQALVAAGAPGGSIIHVGSIVGKVGNLGQANYAASKAGVEGLTRTCAKELARFGIRCNVVLPGFIVTPMTDKVPPKVLEKFAGMVPMGRLGDPQDVADVCAFLASGDSSYITGASVEVTGGLFM